jgi:hypothetical protein
MMTPSPDYSSSRSPQATLDELIPSDTLNVEGVLARAVALLEEIGDGAALTMRRHAPKRRAR